MNFSRINDEVYVTQSSITTISSEDIAFLKKAAAGNQRKRARLCAHPDVSDRLHEMIIVHARAAYVRPHKHVGKSESFHIIEGRLKIFLFDDAGRRTETINMGEPASDRVFYYRLQSSTFHSVLPETEFVVFHEVTNGPFDRTETIFAPWAPPEDGSQDEQRQFMASLLT